VSEDTYTQIPDWLAYRKDFSSTEKLCYSRMSRFSMGKGYGWASQEAIAREIGCEIRQVQRCVRKFQATGLMRISKPKPGSRDTNIFRVFIPPSFLADFEEYQAESKAFAAERERRAALIQVQPERDDKMSAHERLYVVPDPTISRPWDDKMSRKETREETTEETIEVNNPCRGSLRSPQVVSLRSSTQTNSFTENQIPFLDEEFTNKSGFAATALSFQPVTVEAVTDEVREEYMSDEEREARKASLARAALMGAQRFDAAIAAKEAKQRAKAKREASLGTPELPKVKIPKQTLFGSLHDLQRTWMLEFQRKFPNDAMEKSWGPKEGAMLKRLLERWGLADLELAMQYYIRYWEQQKLRYPKIKATLPSLGLFTSLDASVVPEAKKMFTALKAKTEYDQWCDANPSATRAPKELQAAYDAVREDLKALGI